MEKVFPELGRGDRRGEAALSPSPQILNLLPAAAYQYNIRPTQPNIIPVKEHVEQSLLQQHSLEYVSDHRGTALDSLGCSHDTLQSTS